ncbi:hypothetical protein PFNF54_04671 [Plasmodium falciparum NF54]|uniref:Uncharacterized protein n=1 Tax=Plasmodium falciparum (isolate NF54) TaxID=5843 RepID=W7JP42_PLAFO|nr:hypothetical protein PFNF54_04671 [Plasmodium falciparum NF54]
MNKAQTLQEKIIYSLQRPPLLKNNNRSFSNRSVATCESAIQLTKARSVIKLNEVYDNQSEDNNMNKVKCC